MTVELDRPIPGLETCSSSVDEVVDGGPMPAGPGSAEEREVDLKVVVGQGHPWRPTAEELEASRYLRWDEKGDPLLEVCRAADGRFFRLAYSDGTLFTVDRDGRTVWASWSAPYSLEWMATYLLGPVLGFVLRRRGVVSLHAGAVVHRGRALAVAGPPGVGKSTTTTAFARRSMAVLTDDMLPLVEKGGRFFAQPTYPRLRLWGDSVERFWGSPDALPLLTPRWQKRALDLLEQGFAFETRRRPLGAIYVLCPTPKERSSRIEPLVGRAALMALVNNTYVNYLLDAEMRAEEFDLLGRLMTRVPLRRLIVSEPRPRPEAICDLVLEDAETLAVASPCTD